MSESAHLVSLRRLDVRDADVIAGWAEHPGFSREGDWTAGLPYAERRQVHRLLIGSPPAELVRLGVVHDGLLVGFVDLHGSEPHRRELGFAIGEKRRWGRGLGGLAAAAGLDHGFDVLHLREIWAEAPDANQSSVRILQRLGMAETGRGHDCAFRDGPTFYRRFAITAEEWARRRAPATRADHDRR